MKSCFKFAGLITLMMAAMAAAAAPLGTGFTYQGQLNAGAQPINGVAHLRFSLWDAPGTGAPPTGGNQLGVSKLLADVPVANGVFSVVLNEGGEFGATAFNGEARWLQIEICDNAACDTPTVLSPRQPLTGAPYALGPWKTRDTGHVVYTGPGNIGAGTSFPSHRLHVSGGPTWTTNGWSGSVALDNAAAIGWMPNIAGNSFGIGQSTGGLYFFRTTSSPGTVASQANYDMIITDAGRVGVGVTVPLGRLHGNDAGGVVGVYGTSNTNTAMYGESNSGFGVYGYSNSNHGIRAHSNIALGLYATSASVGSAGILAESAYIGIQGNATGADANRQAVRGELINGTHGYAGLFAGTTWVVGNLVKNSGSFKIDHPLDPANKFLSHSFVESPDMMNIYNGVVTTGADGRAEIALPDYFEALNSDFRYQLTVIDAADSENFTQAKVVREIKDNRFAIRTSAPETKVSWQVTGVRRDAWANAHRIVVEEDKGPADRGKYINPSVHGLPREKGLDAITRVAQPREKPAL